MKFSKAFNNNVALVEDPSGTEWIVMGTGVGFQRKKGIPFPKRISGANSSQNSHRPADH
ncbi:CAT RNA binding domain-containing protein [Rossellomorea sp. H39__3]